MAHTNDKTYDAIIIGAGIGGLVCGCYLAKAGMKVLIAEQHHKPGGYCTSFRRKGFTFDAAAHSFGGYREGGSINKVLRELGVCEKLKIKRFDPSDIIVAPDHTITLWTDVSKTIAGLQGAFPRESEGVRNFFSFVANPRPVDIASLRKKTFGDLLARYFTDRKLKAILSLPLLGNGDLPPSLLSAFSGTKIYTEFLLDGGYYPDGGMQMLPDALAARFKELGGELRLSCSVTKIRTHDNTAIGVVLDRDGFVPARYVISNCDARQTFLKLLKRELIPRDFLFMLTQMIPSRSIFVLYLGISDSFDPAFRPGSNVWYLPYYEIESMYASEGTIACLPDYFMVRVSPDKKTILAFVNAPFKNERYWKANKTAIADTFIEKIEKTVFPGLTNYIAYKEAATPSSMYRYTLNYRGAAYGWAGLCSQFAVQDFKRPHFIKGLRLTGHWTTYAQGIPGVAYVGYDTANEILNKEGAND